MPVIEFNVNGLPRGSRATVSPGKDGMDLVVNVMAHARFPHITFHAKRASIEGGTAIASYAGMARYHVAVRSGVYYGRQCRAGVWEDDRTDTTERIMQSDRDIGESYALDIEQILRVS